jgi:hypothetical protein
MRQDTQLPPTRRWQFSLASLLSCMLFLPMLVYLGLQTTQTIEMRVALSGFPEDDGALQAHLESLPGVTSVVIEREKEPELRIFVIREGLLHRAWPDSLLSFPPFEKLGYSGMSSGRFTMTSNSRLGTLLGAAIRLAWNYWWITISLVAIWAGRKVIRRRS